MQAEKVLEVDRIWPTILAILLDKGKRGSSGNSERWTHDERLLMERTAG